jgi:hypothetical protein
MIATVLGALALDGHVDGRGEHEDEERNHHEQSPHHVIQYRPWSTPTQRRVASGRVGARLVGSPRQSSDRLGDRVRRQRVDKVGEPSGMLRALVV